MEKLFKIQNPSLSENLSELRRLAEFINNSDSDSNEVAKLPVGMVKEEKLHPFKVMADYYTALTEKHSVMITADDPELDKTKSHDIDWSKMPTLTASNGGIELLHQPSIKPITADERSQLINEVFHSKTDLSTSNDHDNSIDYVARGFVCRSCVN
jgi:hypothetical protein